uniref:interferon epsilon n=1 Tax=Jaculus jaculus TaxID=51337 RepID=UPI001E1B2C78|nr:interferon epsilon [Jaculus jaculus]
MLLLLASSSIFSLETKLLLFQPRMNTVGFQLLSTLQISSTQHCLPHRKDFLLPLKSATSHQYQKGHVLAILHERLQQIFSLVGAGISVGTWEGKHIEKFFTELHQQPEYPESLMGLEAEQRRAALDSKSLKLQIKAYFRRIHGYLESQGTPAWIMVQVETRWCLFFIFGLTRRLCKQEMDP